MSDEKVNVLLLYQNICNKLKKKRILKKPNKIEASQQFENLGKICEREDLGQYAGLSYQAAAKCQNSSGNPLEETFLLLKSSRLFMSTYLKLLNKKYVPNESYLQDSYLLYKDCLKRLDESNELSLFVKNAVGGSVALEMGNNLKENVGKIEESLQEYKKALQFFSKGPVEKISVMEKIIYSKIELGDFHEPLVILRELIKEAELLPQSGLKEKILCNAEITRILLLLILQPTPQQISPVDACVLEKYAWVETLNFNEVRDLQETLKQKGLSMLSPNLFLALQSLVMACQYCDKDSLISIESDLIPHFSKEQQMLLKILVLQFVN